MQQRRLKGYEYRIWDQGKTIDANLSEWGSYAKQDGEAVRMEQQISGEVIQVGHEGDPCYLMRLPDRRIVTVQCDPETLANDKNRMYQNCHAIVSYDYDILKKTEFNFKLVEWIDEYHTEYNYDALEQSILMAAEGLGDITDPITWTHDLRGNDDA